MSFACKTNYYCAQYYANAFSESSTDIEVLFTLICGIELLQISSKIHLHKITLLLFEMKGLTNFI